jgi:hypothetical protein
VTPLAEMMPIKRLPDKEGLFESLLLKVSLKKTFLVLHHKANAAFLLAGAG